MGKNLKYAAEVNPQIRLLEFEAVFKFKQVALD